VSFDSPVAATMESLMAWTALVSMGRHCPRKRRGAKKKSRVRKQHGTRPANQRLIGF
jgi:hypothetical protein